MKPKRALVCWRVLDHSSPASSYGCLCHFLMTGNLDQVMLRRKGKLCEIFFLQGRRFSTGKKHIIEFAGLK